jgi:membrane-associated phospholipid phosphatase
MGTDKSPSGGEKRRFSLRALLKAHPEYWYVLFVPAYLLCFAVVERLVPSDADYWVSYCRLDDFIPFCEVFVIPYCMWYPLLLTVGLVLMFRDVPAFRRYMYFLILGCGISLLICAVFPNGQDLRPQPFPRENFFTWLLGLIYAADTNTNVLPSMHVVGCAAAAAGVLHSEKKRRLFPPVLVVSVLICLSTVFVKQHSILDLFAGIALSAPIWWLLYRKKRS